MTQRLFVLKDMVFDDDTGNAEIDGNLHGIVQSVNGQLTTNEAMRPGETQLWRFTNQSANRALHIALTGHRFRIVAEDGEATSMNGLPSAGHSARRPRRRAGRCRRGRPLRPAGQGHHDRHGIRADRRTG